MPFFILGIAILVGVVFILRGFVNANPKDLKQILKWVGLILAGFFLVWLAVSGKLWAAVAALPAIFLWLTRLLWRLFKGARTFSGLGGAGQGWSKPGTRRDGTQESDVRTRFVVMRLNHATGQVTGEVLEGRFSGRSLEALSLDEVVELLQEAQVDLDSARVLESYLDRRDPDWRAYKKREERSAGSSSSGMSREVAFKTLGLKMDASPQEIKTAHRRLMANMHPDHGGSDYLAQQINRARDVLLGG